jgi:hypothetical protein
LWADWEVPYADMDQSRLRLSDGVLVDRDTDRYRPRVGPGRGDAVDSVADVTIASDDIEF